MALKVKVSKADWEKLADPIKFEYEEKDGEYQLKLEGAEDTSALRRARDREKQRADEAKTRAEQLADELADAKSKLDDASSSDARKRGDIDTLEKSWQKKLDDKTKELTDKLLAKDGFIQKTLVDNVASGIAHKISNAPGVMMPHIKSRLVVDMTGNEPVTKVLGADGKPSDITIEKLSEEFVANKDFSAIIIGSKASGGGALRTGLNVRPGSTGQNPDKPTTLATMDPADLAASIKAAKQT